MSGKSCWFTFLCIFQPLHKFLHLLEENALAPAEVGVRVPLQDGLFAQYIRCGEENSVMGCEGRDGRGEMGGERRAPL